MTSEETESKKKSETQTDLVPSSAITDGRMNEQIWFGLIDWKETG